MIFLTEVRQQIAMQKMQSWPKTVDRRPAPLRLPGLSLSVLVFLIVPLVLSGTDLSAQAHPQQPTKAARQQKAPAKPAQAAATQREPVAEAGAVQQPSAPTPVWPVNQPPNRARVTWDSRGLEIEASNSSLNQILRQVAADTGAKLEGLSQDQRVFGSYGPGPGSDVLLKLLDGSGYNLLMLGGRDANAPLEIVLSVRSPLGPQPANNQNRNNAADDEPPPPPSVSSEPDPQQNPFAIGEPPRDPQEVMQEILHRQQKIDQEQEQQNQDQQNHPQQ